MFVFFWMEVSMGLVGAEGCRKIMEKDILEISINDLIERGFSREQAQILMHQYIDYFIDEIWNMQSNLLDKIESEFEKKYL